MTGPQFPARSPLALAAILILALAVPAMAQDSGEDPDEGHEGHPKLDAGLDREGKIPVFVRMTDQLLPDGDAFRTFCEERADDPRREVRAEVLAALREKAAGSWETVEETVGELTEAGELEGVRRFWIVNGFAGRATAAACRRLADHDAVGFVYRQTGPPTARQDLPTQGAPTAEQIAPVFDPILEGWADDTDTPLDLEGVRVPWNVQRIGADAAWREEGVTGKGVVVALLDTGLMIAPSLVAALWKNPGEELNGTDDDGNGLVDDLFGYDFDTGSHYCLGDRRDVTHGSMCGGIIAGRSNNKAKMQTGIAPRARLMVLRGMGKLRAYEYALANGADVLSMSYMWPRVEMGHYRGVFRTAHEHMAAGGVVAVGGAGNFSNLPRGKQIALPKDIPCVIAAAGIDRQGNRARGSSGGPVHWNGVKFYDDHGPDDPLVKPDVTGIFGGYPVWGRRPAGRYARVWRIASDEAAGWCLIVGPAGNSFSGPHAAGVAALMLEANPDLPAWRVKELMESTCEDLGEEGRDVDFGAGLLRAREAVRAAKNAAARDGDDGDD